MIVKITQNRNSAVDKTVKTVVISGVGMQGAKGKDANFPIGGTVGSLLEKTNDGIQWTNEIKQQTIIGGYF